jgi:hypothetical protein
MATEAPEISTASDESCAVCGKIIFRAENLCPVCSFHPLGDRRTELLRHIANNTYRIRKHVVFWSITAAVLLVVGVIVAMISIGLGH